MDKNKRNSLVIIAFLAMSAYLFAPVDFIWFVALSLVLGIAESMIFSCSEKQSENWSVGFVCRNIFFGNISRI